MPVGSRVGISVDPCNSLTGSCLQIQYYCCSSCRDIYVLVVLRRVLGWAAIEACLGRRYLTRPVITYSWVAN